MQLVRYHSAAHGPKIALVQVGPRWITAVMILTHVQVIRLGLEERNRMEELDTALPCAIRAFQRVGASIGMAEEAAQLLDANLMLYDPATPAMLARQAH
jgi:hypothetical protein